MNDNNRSVQLRFRVTPEEKKFIRKKMYMSKTMNMSAYLRKMAIDGIVVNVDTTYLKKQYEEMHRIGVNVNQIVKNANAVGAATAEDIAEIKKMLNEIWILLRKPANEYLKW